MLGRAQVPWPARGGRAPAAGVIVARVDTEGRTAGATDWADRVRRLSDDLAGLRRAMRARALIEQAKGLLAGTLDCSPEAAFAHLSQLSQHENRRLVEVAARIMGAAVPVGLDDPPDQPVGGTHALDPARYLPTAGLAGEAPLDAGPEHGAAGTPTRPSSGGPDDLSGPSGAAARVLLGTAMSALAGAADAGDLAERVLTEGLRGTGARAVLIFVAEPDGALRLAGSAGLPPAVASDWRRVPSPVPIPAGEAVRADRPVWLSGRRSHRYLLVGPGQARACLPLRRSRRGYGCLEVVWPRRHEPDPAQRRYLVTLAGAVARRLAHLGDPASRPATVDHWMSAVLAAMPAPVLLLSPVRDPAGEVVDFTIDVASPSSGTPYRQNIGDLVGARLLDVRPHLAPGGVFDAYRRVLRTGTPWRGAPRPEPSGSGASAGMVLVSHAAVRLGDGLLATWQVHDDMLRLERFADAEELLGCGWVAWHRPTGAMSWSPGMYRLLDRPPARGPMPLTELPHRILAADRPRLARELRGWLADPVPARTTLRLSGGPQPRTLRLLIRPTVDAGSLAQVLVVAQDVTELAVRVRAAAIRRVHRGGSP